MALLLAVLPGCGPANPFSIQKAYGDTLGSRTAKLQLTVTVSRVPAGHAGPISVTGSGVADLGHQSFEMTMNLPAGEGRMQAVLSDDTLYMEPPPGLAAAGSPLPAGKRWVAIKLSGLLGAHGASLGPGVTSSDPTAFLEGLARTNSGGVADLGSADLNGIACEHYRIEINLAQVARSVTSDSTATPLTRELASSLAQLPPAIAEVWVDHSDHLRRAVETVSFPGGLQLIEQMDLSDFGVPAVIQAPPADQVFDASASSWAGQVVFPGAAPAASLPTRSVPCPATVLNVFLDPEATPSQIDSVKSRIEQDAPAARVVFVDQDQSYAEFKQLFSSQPTMVNSVTPADLPPSFRVIPNDSSTAQRLISDLDTNAAVRHVESNEPTSISGIGISGFLDPSTMLRYAGPPGPPCRVVA